jgi:formamidopyrimidine-DNA glycosylase
MQALAERLDAALAGRVLAGYQPISFAGLKTVAPPPDALVGKAVERVGRRGKYLVVDFGAGERLLLHLSQSGRVDIEEPAKSTRGKGGVVRFRFIDSPASAAPPTDAGGAERQRERPRETAIFVREFGTERKAAWWVLAAGDDGPLEGLGPEPDSDEFAELVLRGEDRRRVHTWLRDQRTVVGVGRGYADDALWRAQLSPYATLGSLDDGERQRLLDSVRSVLADGLEKERAREGGLSDPKLGTNFEVHGRPGTPCPRCGETLRRVSYESHEVAYCPACQTGGKVLADRRMSRLVK